MTSKPFCGLLSFDLHENCLHTNKATLARSSLVVRGPTFEKSVHCGTFDIVVTFLAEKAKVLETVSSLINSTRKKLVTK